MGLQREFLCTFYGLDVAGFRFMQRIPSIFAVVSVTFVLFARFVLIFSFRNSNWKLELQSVFGGVGEMLH